MIDAVIEILDNIIDILADAAVACIAMVLYLLMGVVEMAAVVLIPIWIVPYLIIRHRRKNNGKSKGL